MSQLEFRFRVMFRQGWANYVPWATSNRPTSLTGPPNSNTLHIFFKHYIYDYGQQCNHCCHSVKKKNTRIYLEKKQKIIKNPRHTKCLKKVQTKLEKHASSTHYLHIKIKVICIICI